MIDPSAKLTVLHDDNGAFIDHSDNAADYLRDEFNMELSSTEDYLYIGYSKPFNTLYAAMTTANVNSNSLQAEYWNGSGWVTLALTDESKGLTRSGYMFWDKSSMKATSVDSKEAYYIRLRPDADHSASVVRGINLVFCDDNALKQEFFEIDNDNFHPTGENSHLVHLVSATNTIVQSLRNRNYKDKSSNSGLVKEINQWDLMDVFQVRQAAVMLTLSKIFFLIYDEEDDVWYSKYKEYQKKYYQAFNLINLEVDQNGDGMTSAEESSEQFKSTRWTR